MKRVMSDSPGLFDPSPRTDLSLRRRTGSKFEYLNTSARGYIDAERKILEGWYSAYPAGKDKEELRGRFRHRDDVQHHGAVFELFNHALLKAMGYEVIIHPDLPNQSGRHPDFLALRNGERCFYLEGTVANLSPETRAKERELDRILEGLDKKLDSPNFYLSPSIERMSTSQANVKKLRVDLGAWLGTLDPDQAEGESLPSGVRKLPAYPWSEAGWEIVFTAYPRAKDKRGRPGNRVIGPRTEPLELDDADRLRNSVESKATRYRELDLRYIVAVNVMGETLQEIEIMEGLFGDEKWGFEITPDGAMISCRGREPNGAFHGPSRMINTRVSAVFVCDHLTAGVLRRPTVLVHHPQAQRRIDPSLWPMPQLRPHPSESQVVRVEGRTAGEVLGIPDAWHEQCDLFGVSPRWVVSKPEPNDG